ncbi:TAP-like protein-domain-containing protein [Ilyonectria sp. MPI-CAGE-AT-0026]|nr:TAP-like protein-domain-containing protein [Ilyonectria sp. MPI-CAGE-AT-0026]
MSRTQRNGVLLFLALWFGAFIWEWPNQASKSLSGQSIPEHAKPLSDVPERRIEWGDIKPSERLKWKPCFDGSGDTYQCARLTVPMDYRRPLTESSEHPRVDIAMKIKGEENDIIGFDPRGVGATTPQANCFMHQNTSDLPDDLLEKTRALINRMIWDASGHNIGLINSSAVALEKLDIRARAFSQLCKQADNAGGQDSIYKYVNTPNVAQDMLSIVDAWDEWQATASCQLCNLDAENDSYNTRDKLVYWGFSYGTFLGATFASICPDRVGRVMLDGVVDADQYVSPTWPNTLMDTDKILDKFAVSCFNAGEPCALYRNGDTVGTIQSRFEDIMDSLKEKPIIILHPESTTPIILTWSDMKMTLFQSLYAPIKRFPVIANLLNSVSTGDDLARLVRPRDVPSACDANPLPAWPDDALPAIMCSDKRYKLNGTLAGLEEKFEQMAEHSDFADAWMGIGLACDGWAIEPSGAPIPWDEHPVVERPPIKTNFPILFLSNHFDPVTHLQAALNMTRKFANATIVEQKAEGHCTLACPNLCTAKHIRAYINDGIVPEPPRFENKLSSSGKLAGKWETCECESKPWDLHAFTAAA